MFAIAMVGASAEEVNAKAWAEAAEAVGLLEHANSVVQESCRTSSVSTCALTIEWRASIDICDIILPLNALVNFPRRARYDLSQCVTLLKQKRKGSKMGHPEDVFHPMLSCK